MKTIDLHNTLSATQAAPLLKLSRRQVLNYCKSGRLGFFWSGRYWISRSEVRRFKRTPHGPAPGKSI